MKNLIYTFTLFGSVLFFCLIAILGIDYGGENSAPLYRYYCVFFFIISMIVFVRDYLKTKFRPSHLFSFVFLLIFILFCLVEGYQRSTVFLCFVAFCIPASCIAIVSAEHKRDEQLVKWLDIVFVIVTISLFFLIRKLLNRYTLGESYYSQRYSYYAAFAFNLDLFLLFFSNKVPRFSFAKTKWYRAICILLLPLFPYIVLISGGRGGFVSMIVGLLLILLIQDKKRSFWIALVAGVLIFAIIPTQISGNGDFSLLFNRNMHRVLSVISSGEIDFTQSAGRNVLYEYCWNLFLAHPFTGYGIFSYQELLENQPYAHNLFLEWLLQGGVFYFLFWVGILFFVIRKYFKIIRVSSASKMLIPIFIFAFTELLFSSTYLEEPLYWFSMMYVINYKLK